MLACSGSQQQYLARGRAMMKSESEAALSGNSVPPYLRACGPTCRGWRYGHHYQPIGGTREQRARSNERDRSGLYVFQRALGVLAVFAVFAVGVSNAHSKWTAGDWTVRGPVQRLRDGASHGMFEVSREI